MILARNCMCSLMMISDMLSKHVGAVKSVLKKWFKINNVQLVHLFLVWYLVNLHDARCNNKDTVLYFHITTMSTTNSTWSGIEPWCLSVWLPIYGVARSSLLPEFISVLITIRQMSCVIIISVIVTNVCEEKTGLLFVRKSQAGVHDV